MNRCGKQRRRRACCPRLHGRTDVRVWNHSPSRAAGVCGAGGVIPGGVYGAQRLMRYARRLSRYGACLVRHATSGGCEADGVRRYPILRQAMCGGVAHHAMAATPFHGVARLRFGAMPDERHIHDAEVWRYVAYQWGQVGADAWYVDQNVIRGYAIWHGKPIFSGVTRRRNGRPARTLSRPTGTPYLRLLRSRLPSARCGDAVQLLPVTPTAVRPIAFAGCL